LIAEAGGNATYLRADVARSSDSEQLVTEALRLGGRIDVLVANAGIGGPAAAIHEFADEDWDAVMGINLRGAFFGLRAAIRHMLEQTRIDGVRGRCIAVASNHGMVGPPRSPAYAASKGGLLNLVRQAAVDYGREGILINAVAPGKILRDGDLAETLTYARARTPFDRLGVPEDVASAVLYLAADASSAARRCRSTAAGWRTDQIAPTFSRSTTSSPRMISR
jgi:glucose 1-dehydrogenase